LWMEVVQNPLGAFGRAEQVGEREFHAAELSTISHVLELSEYITEVYPPRPTNSRAIMIR
jgi:hypothetical protein